VHPHARHRLHDTTTNLLATAACGMHCTTGCTCCITHSTTYRLANASTTKNTMLTQLQVRQVSWTLGVSTVACPSRRWRSVSNAEDLFVENGPGLIKVNYYNAKGNFVRRCNNGSEAEREFLDEYNVPYLGNSLVRWGTLLPLRSSWRCFDLK
jgi:hypothetical protein